MNACELAASITAAAVAVANKLDDDDLSLLAAAATQFGDTLATISAQRSICSARKDNQDKKDSQDQKDNQNSQDKQDKQ